MIQPFKEQIVKVLEKRCYMHHTEGKVISENEIDDIAEDLVKIISFNPPVIGSLPHIHKAGVTDIDECGICGHDLRHEIHVRQ